MIYAWNGFKSPIANPPAFNKYAAGSRVNLPFKLGANFGLGVVTGAKSRPISCANGAALAGYTAITNASSLVWNSSTSAYNYRWLTSPQWGGTCREFMLTLNDGTSHSARVKLTK